MEKLLFNLQLFAGDEQEEIEEETPTEEVEDEVEETEEETDTEFEDSEDEEVEEEKEDKPTQKEQNKINAQRRLEFKKQREQEQEKHKREGYIKGVKEATNGINPYNNQPIEDEYDIEVYQTMVEMSKKGLDPIEDYAKYTAQKTREAQKAEKDTQERNVKEAQDFVEKYGEDTFSKVVQDENFNEFCDGLLGIVPLTTLYERFLKQEAKIEARAKKLALQKEARRRASMGTVKKQAEHEMSWENMNGADFRKFAEGIANRR